MKGTVPLLPPLPGGEADDGCDGLARVARLPAGVLGGGEGDEAQGDALPRLHCLTTPGTRVHIVYS